VEKLKSVDQKVEAANEANEKRWSAGNEHFPTHGGQNSDEKNFVIPEKTQL
jgi:hypothetical protein